MTIPEAPLVPDSPVARSTLAAVSVAGLACAACCAAPVVAALGLGGVAAAGLALLVRHAAVVGAALTLAALVLVLARRRANDRCRAGCAADGSCCGHERGSRR